MSSDQIEQHLATAKRALALALAPHKRQGQWTIRIQPEDEYTPHYTQAAEEMRDTKRRAEAHFAQSTRPASEFGFQDEYAAKNKDTSSGLPLMENYLERPETSNGVTLIRTIKQCGYTKVKLPVLRQSQAGRYTIRVRAAKYADANPRLHYLEFSTSDGSGRRRLG